MGGEHGSETKVGCPSRLQPAKLNYVTRAPGASESNKWVPTLGLAEYSSYQECIAPWTIQRWGEVVESAHENKPDGGSRNQV